MIPCMTNATDPATLLAFVVEFAPLIGGALLALAFGARILTRR
jgi:hypothetical protein